MGKIQNGVAKKCFRFFLPSKRKGSPLLSVYVKLFKFTIRIVRRSTSIA